MSGGGIDGSTLVFVRSEPSRRGTVPRSGELHGRRRINTEERPPSRDFGHVAALDFEEGMRMAGKMDLDKFRQALERRTDRFVRFWKSHHEEDPADFLESMTESEWWEQYSAWEESQ